MVLDNAHYRLDPASPQTPEDHVWWYERSDPFRALIRIAAGIAQFDRGKPSPATFQVLPAFDIEYLDLALIAAQLTDEPAEEAPTPGLAPRPRLPLL